MINALVVLALVWQDADVVVTGHGRRSGGEYELTVTGKGKGLKEQESISLKFRRVANRLQWDDGAIVTAPAGEENACLATVEKNAFVHRERFAVPGEVEVRIGSAEPVTFRTSTWTEEAHAIASASKRFDSALRGVRLMVGDIETARDEHCPALRKQSQVQKRIEWRKNAYRQEIEDSFLTASADALAKLMTDVEAAQELERVMKDPSTLISTLTGKPFSWDDVRGQIDEIDAASLRERALLVVRLVGAMAREIGAVVRSGDTARWNRVEKELIRTTDVLRDGDQAARTGPLADRYGALVESGMESLLTQLREYLRAGESCIRCVASSDGEFAGLGQALAERVTALEQKLSARN
jgi:hypothetical protein